MFHKYPCTLFYLRRRQKRYDGEIRRMFEDCLEENMDDESSVRYLYAWVQILQTGSCEIMRVLQSLDYGAIPLNPYSTDKTLT